ncbi:MAG: SPOR domain-containing protein [Holophagales bacterium]|nr:SPOR domain-containing protein [Holophagales bacterium]
MTGGRRLLGAAAGVVALTLAATLGVATGCARRAPAPAPLPAPLPPVGEPLPEAPVETPTPAPTPVATPTPAPAPAPYRAPTTVRIGLATDLERVTLPCCDGEVLAQVGDTALEVVSPVTLRPAGDLAGKSVFRLQLAALRDEEQAQDLARRLTAAGATPTDARFDAASGLYRVRSGRYPTREAADAAGRAWRGTASRASGWCRRGGLEDAALEITQRGRTRRVEGRRFELESAPGSGLRVEGGGTGGASSST